MTKVVIKNLQGSAITQSCKVGSEYKSAPFFETEFIFQLTVVSVVYFPCLQCESKKSPPLRFSVIFSQTVGNFLSKFYVPVICFYLR